jgi:hypothetical protein
MLIIFAFALQKAFLYAFLASKSRIMCVTSYIIYSNSKTEKQSPQARCRTGIQPATNRAVRPGAVPL